MVSLVSNQFVSGAGLHVLIASMGASAVLLFATPHSPLAQPWPLVGGHLLSAFIGIACAKLVPDLWAATALAVALSIFVMHLTHCLHPPGGATSIVAVLGSSPGVAPDYSFIVAPVGVNTLLILLMALVLNNLFGRRYPARPQAQADQQHRHQDPSPLDRLGIKQEDLHSALKDLDVFLDVSEADLSMVYNRASLAAAQRKMGELTCGDIMSRDVTAVEFATELEEAWTQLRYHRVKVLPVIDRARRVIGIISLVDFLKRANLKTYDTLQDKLLQFLRRTPGEYSDKPEVVGQIMASPALTVQASAHVLNLVPLLADRGLHHVPVVDAEDRLVGMITQSDLIAALYHSGGRDSDAVK